MKDYSKFKISDFQALSDKEFEEYAKQSYKEYISQIKHEDDYFPYSEYFLELSGMMERNKRKSWDSDF
jgi:hypothetical protein